MHIWKKRSKYSLSNLTKVSFISRKIYCDWFITRKECVSSHVQLENVLPFAHHKTSGLFSYTWYREVLWLEESSRPSNQQINPVLNRYKFILLQLLLVKGLLCSRVLAYNIHKCKKKWTSGLLSTFARSVEIDLYFSSNRNLTASCHHQIHKLSH